MSKRTRWELLILLCMYIGYVAFMVCRNTAIVASPEMIADPSLGMDEEAYGRLMAFHSAGGVTGKVLTGVMVDRWGGRAIFLAMLALTAVTTAGFAMVSRLPALAAFNLTGQAAKSGGWPAMTAIIRDWYPAEKHGRVWGIISTSSRVGVMVATLGLGHLLSLGVPWRGLFWISTALAAVALLGGWVFLRSSPKEVGLEPPGAQEQRPEEAHPLSDTSFPQALVKFAGSTRVWLICASMVFTTMMMDFLNFIPLYLTQSLGLSSGAASKAGTAFPAGMFVAVLAAGFLYDKLTPARRVVVIGGLLGTGLSSVYVLFSLPDWGLSAEAAYWTSLVAIFWFGVAVAPAYYLPMSIFSITFGGPYCGFLVCFFDIFGYLGAFCFNFLGGTVIKLYGWPGFLTGLFIVTTAATVAMVAFLLLESRAAQRA